MGGVVVGQIPHKDFGAGRSSPEPGPRFGDRPGPVKPGRVLSLRCHGHGMTVRVILLVEDSPDDRDLTLRALKRANVLNPVAIANDGAEALEYFFGSGAADRPRPALVLLDLKLPKVDGLEVLRRMRADERTRLIPVVILTGSREQEDVLAGYRAGANAYVRKPVKFSDFADVVRTLGMFWLLLNEATPEFVQLSD